LDAASAAGSKRRRPRFAAGHLAEGDVLASAAPSPAKPETPLRLDPDVPPLAELVEPRLGQERQPALACRLDALFAELRGELCERLQEQARQAEQAAEEQRRMLEQCLRQLGCAVPRQTAAHALNLAPQQGEESAPSSGPPFWIRASSRRGASMRSAEHPEAQPGGMMGRLTNILNPAYDPAGSNDDFPRPQSGPEHESEGCEEGGSQESSRLRALVQHPAFDYMISVLIVVNGVFIGIQADYMAQNPGADAPLAFVVLESVFCVLFLVELLMRVAACRWAFFKGSNARWNLFDALVVTTAVIEELFKVISMERSLASNMTFLRVMRLLKLVRVVRIVRVIRVFRELRVMMLSIISTMRTLLWTLICLFMVTFLFSVYLATAVSDYQANQLNADCELYFGTMPRALLSLFQATTGGMDWRVLSDLLGKVSTMAVAVFLMYICLMYYAIMNILTGVCVNHATKAADDDVENVIREELYRHNNVVNHLQKIFHNADVRGTGTLTWPQLRLHLRDAKVRGYFKTLDLEAWDLHTFFDLLQAGDDDEQPCVGIDQFVRGCMRLKCQVKNVDLMALRHDEEMQAKRILRMQQELRREFRSSQQQYATQTGGPLSTSRHCNV